MVLKKGYYDEDCEEANKKELNLKRDFYIVNVFAGLTDEEKEEWKLQANEINLKRGESKSVAFRICNHFCDWDPDCGAFEIETAEPDVCRMWFGI